MAAAELEDGSSSPPEDGAPAAKGTAAAAPAPVVLPWMRVPIAIEAGSGVQLQHVHGLDPRLLATLAGGLGYQELFPVQAAVWRQLAGGRSAAHDMCMAAPTGSGKTLAYALPVVQALLGSRSGSGARHLLRALVVLPTRDLAVQVHALFAQLCPAVGLKAGLMAARSTVAEEAATIVGRPSDRNAGVDVVVATPGRLMAHMQSTPGFTLRRLAFLVVDETDRLLRQSYQEWLPHVLEALPSSQPDLASSSTPLLPFSEARPVKFVVSATLTRDPSKLARLQLHAPRYVAMMSTGPQRYRLPRSLHEAKLLVRAQNKPLALLALLQELGRSSMLVFASSVATTHKLYLLLAAIADLPGTALEYSARLTQPQRAAALEAFRTGSATILVASDAMARGMDMESVEVVINYDAPVHAKTYVHRAGRTARAGRTGRVFTLLRDQDMRHFRAMLRKLDNNRVVDHRLAPSAFERVRPALAGALGQVQELLEAEAAEEYAARLGAALGPASALAGRKRGAGSLDAAAAAVASGAAAAGVSGGQQGVAAEGPGRSPDEDGADVTDGDGEEEGEGEEEEGEEEEQEEEEDVIREGSASADDAASGSDEYDEGLGTDTSAGTSSREDSTDAEDATPVVADGAPARHQMRHSGTQPSGGIQHGAKKARMDAGGQRHDR